MRWDPARQFLHFEEIQAQLQLLSRGARPAEPVQWFQSVCSISFNFIRDILLSLSGVLGKPCRFHTEKIDQLQTENYLKL